MPTYSARGFTGSVTGAAWPIAQLWNPDATARITVWECGFSNSGTTGDSCFMARTIVKGTAGSELTPDAENCWDADKAPNSGAKLGLGPFSVDPTYSGPPHTWGIWYKTTGVGGSGGTGWTWNTPRGLTIPPGQGLVIINETFLTVQVEVYFVWEET